MEMNKAQKVIVYAIIVIIVALLLFPPSYTGDNNMIVNCGYHFLFENSGCRIDTASLITQWIGVLIVGGLAFFVTKRSSKK